MKGVIFMKDYTQELEELVTELKCIESCDNYNEFERHFNSDTNIKKFVMNFEYEKDFKIIQQWVIKKYEEKILNLLKNSI